MTFQSLENVVQFVQLLVGRINHKPVEMKNRTLPQYIYINAMPKAA